MAARCRETSSSIVEECKGMRNFPEAASAANCGPPPNAQTVRTRCRRPADAANSPHNSPGTAAFPVPNQFGELACNRSVRVDESQGTRFPQAGVHKMGIMYLASQHCFALYFRVACG